ncbi:MAG TPA: hypothetical protein VJB36_13580 [Methylomirabilota bacterium]|nr:hypothetical protein [Methylomirabilota bacterium]
MISEPRPVAERLLLLTFTAAALCLLAAPALAQQPAPGEQYSDSRFLTSAITHTA